MTPAEQFRQRAAAWRRLSIVVLDWQLAAPRKREWEQRDGVNETVLNAEDLAELCDRVARWLEVAR